MEIGPGGGAVALALLERVPDYVALEQSPAMAELMRQRGVPAASVRVTDAGAVWPLPAGAYSAVFGSRALHLLDAEHVVRETLRVCGDRAVLLEGRVRRQPDSLRERVRALMHGALAERGIYPREGRGRELRRACELRGGRALGERVLAEWIEHAAISDAIRAWHAAPGLAGTAVPDAVKRSVLDEVRARAGDLGDASELHPCHRRYVLHGYEWSERAETA